MPNLYRDWPEGFAAWKQVSDAVYAAGVDPKLLNLVMIRASQINGWNRINVTTHVPPRP